MTETDHSQVTRYLARVRRGLKGLPNADVDDTVEEMRTHLFEEIGERGDTAEVLADFGDAAEVASAIVERRVRPEDGPPVPQASLGRRYSAWATDVVIGFGPLVIVPTVLYFSPASRTSRAHGSHKASRRYGCNSQPTSLAPGPARHSARRQVRPRPGRYRPGSGLCSPECSPGPAATGSSSGGNAPRAWACG